MTKTKGSVVALRPSCPGEFRYENHENMKEGPCRSKNLRFKKGMVYMTYPLVM